MLLLAISFIAGILTILAPCVLPLLPVIVGGSVSTEIKDRARPYVITLSLAVSIILFTLILKVSTVLVNLSANALDYISGTILIALGAVSIFPETWERLVVALNWQARTTKLLGSSAESGGRYSGPILIGAALGPVFTSCSPTYAFILASVLPHSFASGLIYLIGYSLGLVLALLAVALAGRRVISRFSWAVDTHSLFRRLIGVLFVAIGVIIITGQLVKVETWVANHLPFDETRIERVLLATQKTSSLAQPLKSSGRSSSVLNVQPVPAPAFQGLTNWINGPPLMLAKLRGKVVLVDFWTYSCINCIRSLPYVEKWYAAYHKDGLVVIGISTPEFAFEHNSANVETAVKRDGIQYPVVLDNNYDTWNAFQNDSWPADYLIDKQGYIRYVSLGEGDYNVTEEAIQTLLGIDKPLQTPTSNVPISTNQTPETYFGTSREQAYVGTPGLLEDGTFDFTPAGALTSGSWTLSGTWEITNQPITSESNGSKLKIVTDAKNVYMVAGSSQPESMKVSLSSNVAGQYGSDAPNGTAVINGSRLYHIVSLNKFGQATITLTVPKGVSLYTFTFGS